MGALMRSRLTLVIGLAVCAAPLRADPVTHWGRDIAEASVRFGIDRNWVEAVMRAESGGRTVWQGRPITSSAGAMGLMQLMPGTWADMRRMHGLGANPHDPHDNIIAGAAYLSAMHQRFGYPGLFGAYHAGPARYQQFLSSGRPLPVETRAYMAAITASIGTAWAAPSAPSSADRPSALFIYRAGKPAPQKADDERNGAPRTDALFVVRKDF